jgi:NAD(P)-dependent dehydrogenase (short-subunit alcohol dehydrogenase family)
VVTGAASGIGLATSQRLPAEGGDRVDGGYTAARDHGVVKMFGFPD